jgi:hypothetical protein
MIDIKKYGMYIFGFTLLSFILSQTVNAAGPALPTLGAANNFAILASSGISTTGPTSVVGNMGVSPVTSTAITGFGLVLDSSGTFSKSSLVTGRVYAADYSPPTPANMSASISAMQTAYTSTAGITSPPANVALGAGILSGLTLSPGLYKWSTNVNPSGVVLDCAGNSSSTYIFQIAGTLTMNSGSAINLQGGCQPQNIYWQVAGQATLGTTSSFQGVLLDKTGIAIQNGATLTGAALAQTAVTLIGDTVTYSAPSIVSTSSGSSNGGGSSNEGGAPRTDLVTVLDNINNKVVPYNSTTPVVTMYIRNTIGTENITKLQFYQNQLPATVKFEQNQIVNISYVCAFASNSIMYGLADNIYGVGYSARCNTNYTTYGGTYSGIYTATNITITIPAVVMPVIIPANVTTPVVVPVVAPTVVVSSKTLPFPWLGVGYYEIPQGGANIPATGMEPGVSYWVSSKAFINVVDSWLVH